MGIIVVCRTFPTFPQSLVLEILQNCTILHHVYFVSIYGVVAIVACHLLHTTHINIKLLAYNALLIKY